MITTFQAANFSKDETAAAKARAAAEEDADAKAAVAAADNRKSGDGGGAAPGGGAKWKSKHPPKKRQQHPQQRKGGRGDKGSTRQAKPQISYVELLAAAASAEMGFDNPSAQPFCFSGSQSGAPGLFSGASGAFSKIASRAMSYLGSSSSSSSNASTSDGQSSGNTSSSGSSSSSSKSYNSSSCHLGKSRGAVADAVGEYGTGGGRFCRFAADGRSQGSSSSSQGWMGGSSSSSSSSKIQPGTKQQQQQYWELPRTLKAEQARIDFAEKRGKLQQLDAALRRRRLARRAVAEGWDASSEDDFDDKVCDMQSRQIKHELSTSGDEQIR